jgi:hypothetical protein
MNIIFRFAERGDGGASGPTRSGPSVIDLANNRFRFNFVWPIWLDQHHSKFPARAEFHPGHGYPAVVGTALPPYCGMDAKGAGWC